MLAMTQNSFNRHLLIIFPKFLSISRNELLTLRMRQSDVKAISLSLLPSIRSSDNKSNLLEKVTHGESRLIACASERFLSISCSFSLKFPQL